MLGEKAATTAGPSGEDQEEATITAGTSLMQPVHVKAHHEKVTKRSFDPSSKHHVRLGIATGTLLLLIVIVTGSLMFLMLDDVCRSDTCHRESERLRSNMNTSVDPCQDFYEYACGSFKLHHQLLPSQSVIDSSFQSIGEVVRQRLHDIFAGEPAEGEVSPLLFLRRAFTALNDTRALDAAGLHYLRSMCKDILSATTWQSALTASPFLLSSNPLFRVGVRPSDFNSSRYAIFIDQPSLTLGWHDLVNETDDRAIIIRNEYRELLQTFADKILQVPDARQFAMDVLAFERKLARASTKPSERRDLSKIVVQRQLRDLVRETFFEWQPLLQQMFTSMNINHRVTDEDAIILYDMKYLRQVSQLLDGQETVIKQLIAVRVISSVSAFSTKEVRDMESKLDQVRYGVSEAQDHEKTVVHTLMSYAGNLLGRLYAERYFSADDRQQVTDMIELIREQYSSSLAQAEWMSPGVKREALTKLRKIKANIGYPQWIMDDAVLLKKYTFNGTHSNDGLDILAELTRVSNLNHFGKITRSTVDFDDHWHLSPAAVNANYVFSLNAISFPAAILQPIFYDSGRPAVMNYANIGVVMGHEIGHAFDDRRSHYDGDGNLRNWWDDETHARYKQRGQCFQHQYSDVHVQAINMNLDGTQTLGENMADNGAMQQVLKVLAALDDRTRLPGLQADERQLFFLSYANLYCNVIRDERLRQQILGASHTPAKYRVNVPLANTQVFADAFSCPRASPMNPVNKCLLW